MSYASLQTVSCPAATKAGIIIFCIMEKAGFPVPSVEYKTLDLETFYFSKHKEGV
jgi:hypothetical protein